MLKDNETTLLRKGPKYCPKIINSSTSVASDLAAIHRKLRLSYYHSQKEETIPIHNMNNTITPLLTPKSNADFRKSNNDNLEMFLNMHANSCLEQFSDKNLNPILFKSGKIAKQMGARIRESNMVITKADKGSCLIILKQEEYDKMANIHLHDSTTYELSTKGMESTTLSLINSLNERYPDCLHDSEFLFICNKLYQSSKFYVLPKIHKSTEIINLIKHNDTHTLQIPIMPTDIPSRPIVSNVNSVTSGLSKLLDLILRPLLNVVPSYIKDNYHFLEYLPRHAVCSTSLITWDITSLYTNIDEALGIQAISFWLDNYQFAHIYKRFTKDFILEAIKIVLTGNIFEYKGKFYRQIKGTAMGTNFAPTYAILTIGYLEMQFYKKCEEHFSENVAKYIVSNFKRYIDDCILIWDNNFGDPNLLTVLLNNLHPAIKYIMSISITKIPFLDILLVIESDRIETEIYKKPTDSDAILHFTSCHNRKIKRSIPYSLAIRITRIVSTPLKQEYFFSSLRERLLKYGYPINLVNNAIEKAKIPNIASRRQPATIMPLLYHYASNIKSTIAPTYSLINNMNMEPSTRTLFSGSNPVISFYNSPNIMCYLRTKPPTVFKCNKPRCGTCNIIIPGRIIKLPNRTHFAPNLSMSCISQNVIYCLICSTCSKIYIGSTSMNLTKRITLHRSQTKHRQYTILYANLHFSTCANNMFHVIPIFQLLKNTHESVLVFVENYFIQLLRPELNSA